MTCHRQYLTIIHSIQVRYRQKYLNTLQSKCAETKSFSYSNGTIEKKQTEHEKVLFQTQIKIELLEVSKRVCDQWKAMLEQLLQVEQWRYNYRQGSKVLQQKIFYRNHQTQYWQETEVANSYLTGDSGVRGNTTYMASGSGLKGASYQSIQYDNIYQS